MATTLRPFELIVPDVVAPFVTPTRVRTYAHSHGWSTRLGEDYCAECSRALGVSEHDFGGVVRAGEARKLARDEYD
jgi:hypothetical protein